MRRAVCVCAALLACAAAAGAELAGLAPFARGARYEAASSVLLSAADARGGELGYRLRGELAVRPLLITGDEVLLHFTLESPQLLLRGKSVTADFEPRASLWDERPSSEFMALWSAGRVAAAYLDATDPPDVLNYKRALISLFQFQIEEGEYNETDVSGECEVHYEAVSDLVVRKFKHRCLWEGEWDAADDADSDAPARVERRRAARYELRGRQGGEGGALLAVAADEVVLLRGLDAAAGLKARALSQLTLLPGPPPPLPAPADARAALAARPQLAELALPLRAHDHVPEPSEAESLQDAVLAHRAALEEPRAGSADAAFAMLALLPALRRAASPPLTALLHSSAADDIMEGLARALGLAGAAGAHAAARDGFQLAAPDPPRPALGREYLAALALAPRVDAAVARDALRLAAAPAPAALAPAALLAAAAAARRVQPAAAAAAVQAEAKDYVVKSLAKCKDDECRATRLLALGQLRRADSTELLLQHAERGARRPALAALAALASVPRAQLAAARRRLERLALGLAAPAALEVRAAALELVLEAAAPHPAALESLTTALRRRGPRELRRLCWQRLTAAAAENPELARLLPALDPRPRDWAKRAYDGTSVALARQMGWMRLESTQLAERGVLRRGVVALSVRDRPLLTVELWTLGMESLSPAPPPPPPGASEAEDAAGAGAEAGADEVAAGLALGVAGARRPGVALFSSQGELLGHVWAGAGSEPTPLLRAVLPRAAPARALPLHAGVMLRVDAAQAVALAQDAQAVVSLWGRTARAGLSLRGAGAELLELRLRTAWGSAAARARSAAAPALQLAASLDFIAEPLLCVHTALDTHSYSRNVTLESVAGARRWRVRRERLAVLPAPGRTLALGARNDAACAALGAQHQD